MYLSNGEHINEGIFEIMQIPPQLIYRCFSLWTTVAVQRLCACKVQVRYKLLAMSDIDVGTLQIL